MVGVLGVLGNFLTLIVLSQSKRTNFHQLLIVLSVTDTILVSWKKLQSTKVNLNFFNRKLVMWSSQWLFFQSSKKWWQLFTPISDTVSSLIFREGKEWNFELLFSQFIFKVIDKDDVKWKCHKNDFLYFNLMPSSGLINKPKRCYSVISYGKFEPWLS